MSSELLIVISIVLMLGYIIFLHLQLAKKNIFIESALKRLSGLEKNWNAEELIQLMREMKSVSRYGAFFTDKLFDDKPLNFLMKDLDGTHTFIHYTKNEEDARSILKEGFRFADTFYKTALPVTSDKLDLLVKHNGRKSFGDYLVVICFSDKIFNYYSSELEKNRLTEYSVENILTEIHPFKNENSDIIYQLSNKFVKGYINHQTGDIYSNPDFNPAYDSLVFQNNLKAFKRAILN